MDLTAHTLQLANDKREMKQQWQFSAQKEKEYKHLCNEVRKSTRYDKEE